MDFYCKECNTPFDSKRSLHCHIKAHGLYLGDYYVKHLNKRDLLTKELIPFKNYEQYISDNFINYSNYIKWLERIEPSVLKDWTLEEAKIKFAAKNIKVSPPNAYYTFSQMAGIDFYKKAFGSYSEFLEELDFDYSVERWFNKTLPKDFWEKKVDEQVIFVDSREQKPFEFKNSLVSKLDFGDYTISGERYSKTFIDRKSIEDFKGTFVGGFERFKREMDRCVEFNSYMFVLVEGSIKQIEEDNENTKFKTNLQFLWHNVKEIMTLYPKNVQFIFANSREDAQDLVPKILYFGEKLKNVDLQYFLDKRNVG
jgi:hypothetical protein